MLAFPVVKVYPRGGLWSRTLGGNLGKSQVSMHQVKRTVATLFCDRTQPHRAAIVTCTNHAVATPDLRSPRRTLGLLGKVREGKKSSLILADMHLENLLCKRLYHPFLKKFR